MVIMSEQEAALVVGNTHRDTKAENIVFELNHALTETRNERAQAGHSDEKPAVTD